MQLTTSTLQVVLPIQDVLFAGETERAINARDLWQALEIGKEFANWIKYQIQSLDLEENVDYIVFAKNGKNPKGGRPAVEYMLTLDAAKHIAMASKTPQGKKVRQYFIEVEKRVRAQNRIDLQALLQEQRLKDKLIEQMELNIELLQKIHSTKKSIRPWSVEEEQQLLALIKAGGYSTKEIAMRLERNTDSIRSKIHQLRKRGLV